MEYKNVSKKVKSLWYIRRTFIVLSMLLFAGIFLGAYFGTQGTEDPMPWQVIVVFMSIWSVFFLTIFVFAYVMPTLQYKVYKYKVCDDELWFNCGVIFKNEYVIPFCQIQDFNLSQGPFESLFKVKSLSVFTAGSGVTIGGLSLEEAVELEMALKENVKSAVRKKVESQGENNEKVS
ncbi:MAG: PH domain-containing protein [Clostridia bacterium]|nr:PH domain-containing protein [Clostridia bacterium]